MKILFPKKSRILTLSKIEKKEAPKDFFYGTLSFSKFDVNNSVIDTRPPRDFFFLNFINKINNKFLRSNFSPQKANYIFNQSTSNSKIISFTDWDSINIGLYKKLRKDLKLICGFHGLYDFFFRVPQNIFFNKKKLFIESLKNIDHIFFFGLEDKKKSIEFFKIPEKKTSHFNFGVDTNFWVKEKLDQPIDILSIGSDLNRDYEIFKKLKIKYNLTLITKLNVNFLKNKANIIKGSKNTYNLSDIDIRNYYNQSKIIVVPVKETFQPSGNSVTLQAMACGKPVILSNIKGLWDKELLKDFKNIILVSPNDPKELEDKITLLLKDKRLRDKIGLNAAETARKYFSLERMNRDFNSLLKLKI